MFTRDQFPGGVVTNQIARPPPVQNPQWRPSGARHHQTWSYCLHSLGLPQPLHGEQLDDAS